MNSLTSESLHADLWSVLRDTPYFVVLAVSAAGSAEGIANGINNDHPLIQKIASESEKENVDLYARLTGPTGPRYSPVEIRDLTVQSSPKEFEILSE